MKSVLYVLTALSVFGLALWAYQENYRTQQVVKETQKQVNKLALSIGHDQTHLAQSLVTNCTRGLFAYMLH